MEVLLPNQSRTELGAVRRTQAGAEVAWTVPVDGRAATNLAAVTLSDETLALSVGRDDGVLRLWLPARQARAPGPVRYPIRSRSRGRGV